MTKDDIIRMAKQANLPACHSTHPVALARFAAIVAAAAKAEEREECAQVVDDFGDEWMCDSHELAKIIRARSQQ